MQVSPVLEAIFELSGEKFVWIRDGVELETILGLRNKDRFTEKQYIAVYPTLDIQRGDMLKAVESGDEFRVNLFDYEICDGEKFQGMAFHVSPEEWEIILQQPLDNGPENSSASINDYLEYLQALARVKAPEQLATFQPLFTALESLLSQATADRGSLKEFTPLLTSNRWLEKAVAELLLEWMKQ